MNLYTGDKMNKLLSHYREMISHLVGGVLEAQPQFVEHRISVTNCRFRKAVKLNLPYPFVRASMRSERRIAMSKSNINEERGVERVAAILGSLVCMLVLVSAIMLQLATTAEAKARWNAPSRMPVGSTAVFDVDNEHYLASRNEDIIFAFEHNALAKRPGTATIDLMDSNGNRVASKKVTVYTLEGKNWEFQSVADSRYVLDIQGKSKKNSARMIVYKRNNGKNQRFRFEKEFVMGEYIGAIYSIKCVHSGKYLDVKGGRSKRSQPVIQYSYNGGDNQLWALSVRPDNSVVFHPFSSLFTMVLDVQGGKAKNSARIIQYPPNNGKNQRWILNQK